MKERMICEGEEVFGEGKRTKSGKQELWIYKNIEHIPLITIYYHNDLRHGLFKRFYRNGRTAVECNYENGLKEGIWKEYYENGQIKEEGSYKNSEYTPSNFWLENGEQLLTNGTGKTIETFGANDHEVVEFHFLNGEFVKEVKLTDVRYGKFIPKDEMNEDDMSQ